MTAYTDAEEIRKILGITIDDAKDDVLDDFIQKAQKVLLHYIQIQVIDEEMDGSINGSNTTFTCTNKFIADTNYDKAITTSDFTINGWTDEDDPTSKVTLTVSTFDAVNGFFKLATAPDCSTYDTVTITYSYYTCKIDWDMVELATTYYAAMLWAAKELYLVPEDLVIGNIRIRNKRDMPYEKLRMEFLRIVNIITALPMDVNTYRKIMRSPRSSDILYGPGTSYELDDSSESKTIKPDLT